MSSYYHRVVSEIICVIGWVSSHMWDKISVPYTVRMRKGERMRSKEKRSKTNLRQVQRNRLKECVQRMRKKDKCIKMSNKLYLIGIYIYICNTTEIQQSIFHVNGFREGKKSIITICWIRFGGRDAKGKFQQ